MGRLRQKMHRALVRSAAAIGRPLKLDVVARWPSSPLPDLGKLRGNTRWRRPRSLAGVAGINLDQQVAVVDSWRDPDVAATLQTRDIYEEAARASGDLGGGFGKVEAELLYALVRRRRPQRIVMAGSWIAAATILIAAKEATTSYTPQIVCLDPDPRPWLREIAGKGQIDLRVQRPQDAPFETYSALQAGDVLFIDSSHAVLVDAEVNHVVLEVLPRLASGVLVHFHGINFPYDYGRHLLSGDPIYAGEGALIQAFLSGNRDWKIAISLSMLHYGARDALAARFPNYRPAADQDGLDAGQGGDCPNSLWIERTG